MKINKLPIGRIKGQQIFKAELTNKNKVTVCISNLGATIAAILLPDRNGSIANTVLSYDSPNEYFKDKFYVGATVGRFAGRISKGSFSIAGKLYQLLLNDGNSGNHLHGGRSGFNKKIFKIEVLDCNNTTAAVQLYYKSKDMEEGYPGNLEVWITFELTEENELNIKYRAKTDGATYVNLTNHSYFNLGGENANALEQFLFIDADKYLATNKYFIPTGEIKKVKKTLNDFRVPQKINKYNLEDCSNGYNGYFILNKTKSRQKDSIDLILFDAITQRKIEVRTSLPGLVFYGGEYLIGKFRKCAGVCMETQFFPDAPNHPEFKGALLLPGEVYNEWTSYKFSW